MKRTISTEIEEEIEESESDSKFKNKRNKNFLQNNKNQLAPINFFNENIPTILTTKTYIYEEKVLIKFKKILKKLFFN